MVWLVSYPRSGNTYVRNILYHVYGQESSVYHQIPGKEQPADYADFPFVKTHLLPDQLPEAHRQAPVVYIIRDGRDAVISEAWHRKNFHDKKSRVRHTMLQAILAEDGSYFGGWGRHVQEWLPKADVVLRFRDLLIDPIQEVEKIRSVADLPDPDTDHLPTFLSQKTGEPRYGKVITEEGKNNFRFFRKGKVGAWQEEMPKWMQDIFWRYHGPVMHCAGYEKAGEVADYPDWQKVAEALRQLDFHSPERLRTENLLLRLTKMGLR